MPAAMDPRFKHPRAPENPIIMLRHLPGYLKAYFARVSETGVQCRQLWMHGVCQIDNDLLLTTVMLYYIDNEYT